VRIYSVLLLVLLFPGSIFAQTDSATGRVGVLRGAVTELRSHAPIARARIAILTTKLGAVSNESGEFRVTNIPVGRYTVQISANGYATTTREVVIGSAHQVVIEIELEERIVQGDTLTISGQSALGTVSNVAAVSAMPFNIEDVNRYAGGYQDPSRMAQNFAGVYGQGTSNNYIVVRGGSPIELLWRLDGIDIPNPNHFGKNGSSGGLISAINSAMLGNSDFLTGAFPAEYGTRMSAAFDMHTRDGNTERVEGTLQLSVIGSEVVAEAPIPGLEGSSVIAGYRHSTLGLLREFGILDFEELPDFDDAMLKLNFKLGGSDKLSATGIWGDARINSENTVDGEIPQGTGLLVGGLNWQHLFSEQLISNVRVNYVKNRYTEAYGQGRQEETSTEYATAKAEVTYLPSSDHSFTVGLSGQHVIFSLLPLQDFTTYSEESDAYYAYLNWNWRIIPRLVLNTGVFSQWIDYNKSNSLEPRASLAWSPFDEHTFAVAYGIHRQPEPIEFAQAEHFVLGYTYRPSSDIMIKAEAYEKRYSDVPIHASTKDSYSFLNEGFAEHINYYDLINAGEGRTYGAELSLFKHYNDGYYITTTASYVRQEFAGSDGIWHFGSFDNQYILNILGGYDFPLSNSSTFTLSEKFTIAGGGAQTPIDLEASREAGRTVRDEANAYGQRKDPYIRLDINAEFHFNWDASRFTIYASILNALDIENVMYDYYSSYYDEVRYDYDVPIIPVIGLRYEF
jgi:hypothetical protein